MDTTKPKMTVLTTNAAASMVVRLCVKTSQNPPVVLPN